MNYEIGSSPQPAAGTEQDSVCLDDLPGPDNTFVESFAVQPRAEAVPPRRLPRSWADVEAMVEGRLAQFEERHTRESRQQYELGIQEGFRRQEATLRSTLDEAAEPIQAIVTRLESVISESQDQVYSQSVALASAMAAQWIGDLVSINEHVFLSAMRDAFDPLRHLDRVTIRLHPDDYETLKRGLDQGDASCARFGSVDVVPDTSVQRGGAVSISEGGSIDARLETRIRRALELIRMDTNEP